MKVAFILLSLMVAYVITSNEIEGENSEDELCGPTLVKKTTTFYVENHEDDCKKVDQRALQGRPGKSGAKGHKGDVGLTGNKGEAGQTGEKGFCSCAVTDERFNEMSTIIQELRSKDQEMSTTIQELRSKDQEMSTTIQNLPQQVEDILNKRNCQNKERLYFGGKCFFMTKTTTRFFSGANNNCGRTQEGSQLASITSAELYNVLDNFIRPQVEGRKVDMWTSGRYEPITGGNTIRWSDGTTTDAWRWFPGYPQTGSSRSTLTHIYMNVQKDPSTSVGLFNYKDNYSQCHSLCSYSI